LSHSGKITDLRVLDVRFPTSLSLDGSDAMNPDPDYSAAYVILETDGPHQGHGLTFTIGRGNEIVVTAVRALAPLVVGKTLASITANMGEFWRHITGDSQLRWIGPEKGAIHLATAAVVNAVWDLVAKRAGKPVWKLLADMSPAQIVAAAGRPPRGAHPSPTIPLPRPRRSPAVSGGDSAPASAPRQSWPRRLCCRARDPS